MPPEDVGPVRTGYANATRVLLLLYACWGDLREPCRRNDTLAIQRLLRAEGCSRQGCRPLPAPPPPPPPPLAQRRGRRLVSRAIQMPAWVKESVREKARYARRHGYAMHVASSEAYRQVVRRPRRPRAWGTCAALQMAVEGRFGAYDWVLYVDVDTVFTTPHREALRATGALRPAFRGAHVFMTRDWNGINTGIVLARCSATAARFFRAAWARGSLPGFDIAHPWNWQLAVHELWATQRKAWTGILELLPQRAMNSYPPQTPGLPGHPLARWHRGDLLLHLAGCGDQQGLGRSCEHEFWKAMQDVEAEAPTTTTMPSALVMPNASRRLPLPSRARAVQ